MKALMLGLSFGLCGCATLAGTPTVSNIRMTRLEHRIADLQFEVNHLKYLEQLKNEQMSLLNERLTDCPCSAYRPSSQPRTSRASVRPATIRKPASTGRKR